MHIKYLGDYSRASSGQDVRIRAIIVDELEAVTENCRVSLWSGTDVIFEDVGTYNGQHWTFVIPAGVTIELHGRYYFAISHDDYSGARQPITII